jgi:hypothetical protein
MQPEASNGGNLSTKASTEPSTYFLAENIVETYGRFGRFEPEIFLRLSMLDRPNRITKALEGVSSSARIYHRPLFDKTDSDEPPGRF